MPGNSTSGRPFCQLQCRNRETLYLSDILRGDGQEVDFVSQAFGRLDSGDVGVDQHSLDVLFLQSLNSLEKQNKTTSAGTLAKWAS